MRRRWWWLLWLPGIALDVIGLAGVPGDLRTLREIFSTVDADTLRWSIFTAGMVLTLTPPALWLRDRWKERRARTLPPRPSVAPVVRRSPQPAAPLRASDSRAEPQASPREIPASAVEAARIVLESSVVELIAKLSEPDEPPGTIRSSLPNPQEQEQLAARKVAIAERLICDFEGEHPDGDSKTLKKWLAAKHYEVATKGVPK